MVPFSFHDELLKIPESDCFGVNASGIIHVRQTIRAVKEAVNPFPDFRKATFRCLTVAEAYRVAVLTTDN